MEFCYQLNSDFRAQHSWADVFSAVECAAPSSALNQGLMNGNESINPWQVLPTQLPRSEPLQQCDVDALSSGILAIWTVKHPGLLPDPRILSCLSLCLEISTEKVNRWFQVVLQTSIGAAFMPFPMTGSRVDHLTVSACSLWLIKNPFTVPSDLVIACLASAFDCSAECIRLYFSQQSPDVLDLDSSYSSDNTRSDDEPQMMVLPRCVKEAVSHERWASIIQKLQLDQSRHYACTFGCTKTFTTKGSWTRHEGEQGHQKVYVCPVEDCPAPLISRKFSRLHRLQEHLNKCHPCVKFKEHEISAVQVSLPLDVHAFCLFADCGLRFDDWESRTSHYDGHFRQMRAIKRKFDNSRNGQDGRHDDSGDDDDGSDNDGNDDDEGYQGRKVRRHSKSARRLILSNRVSDGVANEVLTKSLSAASYDRVQLYVKSLEKSTYGCQISGNVSANRQAEHDHGAKSHVLPSKLKPHKSNFTVTHRQHDLRCRFRRVDSDHKDAQSTPCGASESSSGKSLLSATDAKYLFPRPAKRARLENRLQGTASLKKRPACEYCRRRKVSCDPDCSYAKTKTEFAPRRKHCTKPCFVRIVEAIMIDSGHSRLSSVIAKETDTRHPNNCIPSRARSLNNVNARGPRPYWRGLEFTNYLRETGRLRSFSSNCPPARFWKGAREGGILFYSQECSCRIEALRLLRMLGLGLPRTRCWAFDARLNACMHAMLTEAYRASQIDYAERILISIRNLHREGLLLSRFLSVLIVDRLLMLWQAFEALSAWIYCYAVRLARRSDL